MHPSGTRVSGCRARARGGWRTALGRGRRSGISWPRIARTPALTACPRPPGARRAAAAGPRSGARPGEPAGGARAAGARETGHQGPQTVREGSGPLNAPPAARHCAPQPPPAPILPPAPNLNFAQDSRSRPPGAAEILIRYGTPYPLSDRCWQHLTRGRRKRGTSGSPPGLRCPRGRAPPPRPRPAAPRSRAATRSAARRSRRRCCSAPSARPRPTAARRARCPRPHAQRAVHAR